MVPTKKPVHPSLQMSHDVRKRIFAYAKTKTQFSFAVTTKLISAYVFTARIVQFLYFLNTKFKASSHLLLLHSLVCVGPDREPRRPVFLRQGSNDIDITFIYLFIYRDN